MAAVVPPNITYMPSIILLAKTGVLSSVQLEAIIYACQRHNCTLPSGLRAGFFIGDGAGVGKVGGPFVCTVNFAGALVRWHNPQITCTVSTFPANV